MALVFMARFFWYWRPAVYENGIQFPSDASNGRGRFIAWPEVERYHWDGDILTVVPTASVIGGAELGRPLLGGAVRIPPGKRVQMENLLAGKLSAAAR